jgi:hypothetical protein
LQEDFEWVPKEIAEGGGEAMICEARLINGLSSEDIRAMFNAEREEAYLALTKEVRVLEEALRHDRGSAVWAAKVQLTKLKARADHLYGIDFFGANGRETLDGLLGGVEMFLNPGTSGTACQSGEGQAI